MLPGLVVVFNMQYATFIPTDKRANETTHVSLSFTF